MRQQNELHAEPIRTIESLHIYPIKGCKAIDATRLVTTLTGFAYDRQWVIVKEDNLRFITQRNFPRLALIEPSLPSQLLSGEMEQPSENACLEIKLPVREILYVPLLNLCEDTQKEITVDEWTGMAQDEGDAVAKTLSTFLEESVRLFRFVEHHHRGWNPLQNSDFSRRVDSTFAPGYGTTFTDGYPYLIINQSSVCDVNEHVGREIPSNRFRPNIVIFGNEAWEEDSWREIKISNITGERVRHFYLVKPCKRCKVTTVDQKTAYPDFEPLSTLTTIRNGTDTGFSVYLPECRKNGFFGWNAVCTDIGFLSVGDTVEIVNKGEWKGSISNNIIDLIIQKLKLW